METVQVFDTGVEWLRKREFTSESAKTVHDLAKAIAGNPDRQSGIKGFSSGRSDDYRINPFLIKIKPGFNARDFNSPENAAHIVSLAESIALRGVLKPLTVYLEQGELWLSDGECRLLATFYAIEKLGANIETVPVINEQRGLNDADRTADQHVHNSGKPFTPLELSEVVKRLLSFGWEPAKIATKTGITQVRQSQLLDLAAVPEDVKAMVSQGEVSAHMAVQTVKSHGTKAKETLDKAVTKAKESGRKRALPRDVAPTKEAKVASATSEKDAKWLKKAVKNLFQDAMDRGSIDNSDPSGKTIVRVEGEFEFTESEFDFLVKALHLKV